MNSTESENEQPIESTTVTKIDRRKTKRAPWRYTTLEDGTVKYNHKPIDPLYFQKYYDEKRKFDDARRHICVFCNKEIAYGHKARHEKTKHCIKARNP